jgi:hypothetical protein
MNIKQDVFFLNFTRRTVVLLFEGKIKGSTQKVTNY